MASASTLPTELIQSILLQTDPETYLSAHQTCRSWRRASSSPYMLRHTLQQIPASLVPPLYSPSPPPIPQTKAKTKTDTLTPEQWTAYFAQTARLNLLSRRRHVRKSVCKVRDLCHEEDESQPLRPSLSSIVQSRSEDGEPAVVLRGAKMLVFRARVRDAESGAERGNEDGREGQDEYEDEYEDEVEDEIEDDTEFTLSQEFPLASSLYPQWTSICRALMDQSINPSWSGNHGYSKHRVAVSSRGEFVAVALGRVIQVYGLGSSPPHSSRGQDHDQNPSRSQEQKVIHTPENTHQTPAEYVLGQDTEHIAFARVSDPRAYEDTDGIVEGIEFVDNDTLLRVAIGKESTIHRPTRVRYLGCPDAVTDGPDLNYWRDAIKKVYLDSAALGVLFMRGGGGGARCDLRGLRLLGKEVVDVRGQWDDTHSHLHSHSSSPSTPSSTTTNQQDHRYFVASIQTGTTDTYCIGRATTTSSSPVSMHLLRLLPSIYSRPSSIIPMTPQTKDYPCLYAYPHRPDTTQAQSQTHSHSHPQSQPPSPPPRGITKRITHSYNLQTTLPRFTSTNLPSGTFSSPHVAVSDDAQIMVIYEPDHACCVVEGGALYVCYVGICRSVYQPGVGVEGLDGEVNLNSGSGSSLNAEGGEEGQEGRGGEKQPYPRRDIIPTWPFLLDRVSVDIESLKVKTVRRGNSSKYKVTGIAGDEEIEWLF
ncbi:F-box protein [Aspergillus affinis]|uniref:F-box protein n=1 Tax=Aspergillus affinis TaxID=1070780 RepID=UPI0022FEDDDB|nr:uncharacterized protein KD926_001839 [Aspergillus affinis]KAI9036436.1 hypothetical protein KD926_001839 [Aspergillus affinis]